MKKRAFAVVGAAAAIGVLAAAGGAQAASSSAGSSSLPPACVTEPLPNPVLPGAQLEIGYCPSGPDSGIG
jgi:hypothetical protein